MSWRVENRKGGVDLESCETRESREESAGEREGRRYTKMLAYIQIFRS